MRRQELIRRKISYNRRRGRRKEKSAFMKNITHDSNTVAETEGMRTGIISFVVNATLILTIAL
jgi:hypothetical protein